MIRVAIADDHSMYRRGVVSVLNTFEDTKIVVEASNGIELFKKMDKNAVDILLLDIKMDYENGIEICKKIKFTYPKVKVIALTNFENESYIISMIEAGASSYLLKNVEAFDLHEAIIKTEEDGFYFDSNISIEIIKKIIDKKNAKSEIDLKDYSLSDKEIEILKMICQEYNSQEIGDKLNLSYRTIERYRISIMFKTGSKNVVGMVNYAIRNGIHVV